MVRKSLAELLPVPSENRTIVFGAGLGPAPSAGSPLGVSIGFAMAISPLDRRARVGECRPYMVASVGVVSVIFRTTEGEVGALDDPLERGQETDLIEIPTSWYLNDLPPMIFIKAAPNSHGFVSPRVIEELWRDQFDWVYREYDYAVFPLTIHPDVSGKPQVLLMLERLFEHMSRFPGVKFVTMEEIADDFAKRFPRSGKARPLVLAGRA